MSADGSTFVVGAPGVDIVSSSNNTIADAGQVSVYKFNATANSYELFGTKINGKLSNSQFGTSVSISADGSTFIVGASGDNIKDDNSTYIGRVSIYKFNESLKEYTQFGPDITSKGRRDLFGYSVSLSADGSRFAVGAPYHNANGSVTRSGYARVYQLDSVTREYSRIGQDFDGDSKDMYFGFPVSMSADGSTFFVGAPGYSWNSTLIESGQVRAFKLKTLAVPVPTKVPTMAPVKVPVPAAPSTKVPIAEPVTTSPNNNNSTPVAPPPSSSTTCGLFGLKLFCPRRGKCGLLRRLLKINGC
jgi:hypothetical protein